MHQIIAAAEVFKESPAQSIGLIRGKISAFLNRYGPSGFNNLTDGQMTLLVSMGVAVGRGKISADNKGLIRVMNFMKVHVSTVANRSAINTQTVMGIPITSGGTTSGFSPTSQYTTGPSVGGFSGEPVGATIEAEPPTVTTLIKSSFVDTVSVDDLDLPDEEEEIGAKMASQSAMAGLEEAELGGSMLNQSAQRGRFNSSVAGGYYGAPGSVQDLRSTCDLLFVMVTLLHQIRWIRNAFTWEIIK